MGYKLFAFIAFVFLFTVHVFTSTLITSAASPRIPSSLEVTTSATEIPTLPDADVLIVVDRNPRVERAQIYRDGVLQSKTYKVSTGREKFEFPPATALSPSCTTTPLSKEGTSFTPLHLNAMWESRTY